MKKGILMLLTLVSLVCVLCSCGECTEHEYGDWTVKTAATCTAAGERERVCTKCENVETEAIAATGHSFTKEEVLAEDANLASAATCTAKATYYKLCAGCNAASTTDTFESGDVAAHSFTKEEVLTDGSNLKSAADCVNKAVYYKLCAACDAKSDSDTFESGEPAAHSYTKEVVLANNANLASAATCTAKATYYKLCAGCDAASTTDTFESGDVAAHVFTREAVLAEGANLVSAATCQAKAVYYKLCATCDAASDSETFEYGEIGEHNYTTEFIGGDLLSICDGCNGFVELAKSPSASQNAFSIDVTFADGVFVVPGDKVQVSGFYFVTLEGTTKVTSGYKGLYNVYGGTAIYGDDGDIDAIAAASKNIISQNRDKADGYLYTVYLTAGADNVIAYQGATVTKANFTLAEPVVDGSIVVVGGKPNVTVLNAVDQAAFKANDLYQLRDGSLLQFNNKITVATGSFFSIGAYVGPTDDAGTISFTFTDANGNVFTATCGSGKVFENIGNPELRNGGSEAAYYAPDLAAVYLPAGEYTLTVSETGVLAVMIGTVSLTPMTHVCQPAVSFDKAPTCTEGGYSGTACPVCKDGVTMLPALGHSYGEGVTTNATCEADGSTVYTCASCGDTKTDVLSATGHAWGEWTANAAGTEETRTCADCNGTETRAVVVPDENTLYPTFTTEDNKTWTITVPADQIAKTGIYRLYFKTSGNWAKQYMRLESSSQNIATANRFKDTTTDENGYSMWWIETYIEKGDADVTLTFSFAGAQGDITEMKLSLLAEVVAVTNTKIGTENGSFASVAAGTYNVVTFATGFNTWSITATVNGTDLTVSNAEANGNQWGGTANYDGSTGTAHYLDMGSVTFAADATDVVVSTSGSGQNINVGSTAGASQKGYIPVFLVIPAA